MMHFTKDEINLMAIYSPGSREGLIRELTEMRTHLAPDETELREMTDSMLNKLGGMSDAAFDTLDLIPDFDLDETEELF